MGVLAVCYSRTLVFFRCVPQYILALLTLALQSPLHINHFNHQQTSSLPTMRTLFFLGVSALKFNLIAAERQAGPRREEEEDDSLRHTNL